MDNQWALHEGTVVEYLYEQEWRTGFIVHIGKHGIWVACTGSLNVNEILYKDVNKYIRPLVVGDIS